MRLVVDTNVLVGELLRATGRQRLGDERLDLFLAEQMRKQTKIELPRRIGTFARARGLEPAVACALLLNAGIWTNDNDFLGTGVPTWTTGTLQAWLDRHAQPLCCVAYRHGPPPPGATL